MVRLQVPQYKAQCYLVFHPNLEALSRLADHPYRATPYDPTYSPPYDPTYSQPNDPTYSQPNDPYNHINHYIFIMVYGRWTPSSSQDLQNPPSCQL